MPSSISALVKADSKTCVEKLIFRYARARIRSGEDRKTLQPCCEGECQMVLAAINTVFAQDSFDSAIAQWRVVADQLRPKFHKLSELMDGAAADVLAYMGEILR